MYGTGEARALDRTRTLWPAWNSRVPGPGGTSLHAARSSSSGLGVELRAGAEFDRLMPLPYPPGDLARGARLRGVFQTQAKAPEFDRRCAKSLRVAGSDGVASRRTLGWTPHAPRALWCRRGGGLHGCEVDEPPLRRSQHAGRRREQVVRAPADAPEVREPWTPTAQKAQARTTLQSRTRCIEEPDSAHSITSDNTSTAYNTGLNKG